MDNRKEYTEEEIREIAENVVNKIIDVFNQLVDGILSVFEVVKAIVNKIKDFFWNQYKEAGYPYGDNWMGFNRWIGELSESVG